MTRVLADHAFESIKHTLSCISRFNTEESKNFDFFVENLNAMKKIDSDVFCHAQIFSSLQDMMKTMPNDMREAVTNLIELMRKR